MTKKMLYYYAHECVLMRLQRERDRIEENPKLEMPIAHYRADKYRKELAELESEMLKMEQERT